LARSRKTDDCARVTVASGQNRSGDVAQPPVIPAVANVSTKRQAQWPTGTSANVGRRSTKSIPLVIPVVTVTGVPWVTSQLGSQVRLSYNSSTTLL
jgi:hypothetical protein